jgi:glycosyltransferase involved in cell wall biosynthesis
MDAMESGDIKSGKRSAGHVAFFLPLLSGGGAERVMVNLAAGFIENGVRVDFVLARAEGPYLDQLSRQARLVDLKSAGVLTSLPGLVRYLRRERPAALISALDHANIVAIWAKLLAGTGTRTVVTLHNTLSVKMKSASRISRGRLLPLLIHFFLERADAIIAVSTGVAEDYARAASIPLEKIKVIYNPVISDSLLEKSREPLDHPWFGPGEIPVILSVGRLTEQKNFPGLIEAFARVRQKTPARLLILGEGKLRSELEELVEKLGLKGEVSLPGFVENPYRFMSRAAVFVLSSTWEGLPTVLIEALAAGAPVVATDCKSGPNEILMGGKLGKLVPVGDVPALAEAICDCLTGNRSEASADLLSRFTLERTVQEYLSVVEGGRL